MAHFSEGARESTWILRAQSGDRDALDRLFQAYQERLFGYIAGLTCDPALAEDILQEVLLRIYRKLRWLRDPELFRPWAYRIATNEAFRRLRREREWREQVRDEDLLDRIPVPECETSVSAELRASLPAALARLSTRSRAVIALYYLHELSFAETAAVLGIPVGTVKSRLAYGLATLRKEAQR